MGKIEQIKLARKMLKEEQKQGQALQSYRNKIFMYGFGVGALTAVLLSSAFFASRNNKTSATNNLPVPPISTGSGTLSPDLNLPPHLQIQQPSPTPIL